MKKDTKSLIDALSSGPVRQYLTDHEHSDLREIILKHKEIFGIPAAKIFEQVAVRKKAKDKLPLYYHTPGIVYPPQENFEQSSSEKTAVFKSDIIDNPGAPMGSVGADLTGGFGVDTYFFSRKFEKFHAVEPNGSLLDISKFNHRLLGATNIAYHTSSAQDFIQSTPETFDFVYIDPSRRTTGKKKVSGFENAQPDIIKLAPAILEKTRRLMIKASPLLDIQAGISQLPFVSSVFVVSVSNECKEVLFLCEKDHRSTTAIEAVNLLPDDSVQTFSFTFSEERAQVVNFSEPRTYLYEPNASILKAGAFKSVASRYHVDKIDKNTHLYTSDELVGKFPGRKFRIVAFVRPDPGEVKRYIPGGKANVTTRNYPLSAESLKKKAGLKDGGDNFLIGFSGMKKKYVVVATRIF